MYSEAIFPFSEDIFNGRYTISIRRLTINCLTNPTGINSLYEYMIKSP